ncbi:histidine--tRNA ligase [Eikenella sp. S3360]|uniref:Histidine--tRNA ligase n=1 Tax=Eikenella glucosivorans TaxID=2766967 RepID=A0ABS0N8U9_9NEIS|nr:histidine--tRNA ligase [Eikenella glucosivorans]MBH5328723.1 histidine--tRNA ligase [Eikenella glucosivorans]
MGQKIQAVKGMNDLLPVEQKDFKLTAAFWQAFENTVGAWTRRFGYRQIRTPIVEQTGLFVRSIGEDTDVVGKEMYTFADSNDTLSLSLRPEGTASCLRAVVEHNLLYNGPQKLWYMGPMFRRERPQKGRYRQFHQVGVEALGFEGPDIDAEIIAMCADLWRELGISQYLTLEINSLGNREERAAHRAALVGYLKQHENQLDEDSRRRMHTNPLRVLDSKNPDLQEICNAAPRLADYLGEASRAHYAGFKALLDGLGIAYVENHRLVRGLDYYNQTVFEWTTDKLGAQATVCGGGRYDGLIEELGGKPAPSIGFAMGVERLLLLVREYGSFQADAAPDIYVVHHGGDTLLASMRYAAAARAAGFSVLQHSGSQKLAAQMKKADASGAKVALIVGEGELAEGTVSLKDMQQGRGQVGVPAADLLKQLNEWIN